MFKLLTRMIPYNVIKRTTILFIPLCMLKAAKHNTQKIYSVLEKRIQQNLNEMEM